MSATVLALLAAQPVSQVPAQPSWHEYDATQYIGTDFKLHWRIDSAIEYIEVRLEVRTAGWVGFGIGEPGMGSMKGSDLVYAWVTPSGDVSVTDAFATANGFPTTDQWQDWVATAHSEAGGVTDVTLRRRLAISAGAEGEDRPIVDDGTRTKVQLAWGTADGMNGHSGTMQAASAVIDLFAGVAGELEMEAELAGQSHGFYEVAVKDYPGHNAFSGGSGTTAGGAIPSDRTAYVDYCVPLTGAMDMNASLTGVAYKYGAGLRGYIHHVSITGFESADCSGDNMILALTTPAQGPMVLPPDVGFLLGQDGDGNLGFGSIEIQMHYDNPAGVAGLVDTTSVRFYHTEPGVFSQYRAGIVAMGDVSVQMASLKHLYGDGSGRLPVTPAGHSSKTTFYCDTSDWPQGVQVHEHLHHMHVGGDYLQTVHRNAAGDVVETETTEYYSFAHQDMIRMPEPEGWFITPGDTFATSCYHKNNQAGDGLADEWGLGSNQEMCQDFMVVWPYVPSIPFKCQTNDVSEQTVVPDPVRVFGRRAVGANPNPPTSPTTPTTSPATSPTTSATTSATTAVEDESGSGSGADAGLDEICYPPGTPGFPEVACDAGLACVLVTVDAVTEHRCQPSPPPRQPEITVVIDGSLSELDSAQRASLKESLKAEIERPGVTVESIELSSGSIVALVTFESSTSAVDANAVLVDLAQAAGAGTLVLDLGDGTELPVISAAIGHEETPPDDAGANVAVIAGAVGGGCAVALVAAVLLKKRQSRRRLNSRQSNRVSPTDGVGSLRASQHVGESTEDLIAEMP